MLFSFVLFLDAAKVVCAYELCEVKRSKRLNVWEWTTFTEYNILRRILTLRVYTSVRIVKIIVYIFSTRLFFIHRSFRLSIILSLFLAFAHSFMNVCLCMLRIENCLLACWFHNFAYMTNLSMFGVVFVNGCFKCISCWNSSNKENSKRFQFSNFRAVDVFKRIEPLHSENSIVWV